MRLVKTLIKQSLARFNIDCTINAFIEPVTALQNLVNNTKPVIVDVGAHRGETYQVFRTHFPDASLHLVEPFPASMEALHSVSKGDEHCSLHDFALSKQNGTTTLFVNDSDATNSLYPLEENAAKNWQVASLQEREQISVEVKTLDDLAKENGIETIDILKLDVQGAEMDVLLGAQRLLNAKKIHLIQMEHIVESTYQTQQPLHSYLEFLTDKDYRLVDFYKPIRRNGKLLQFDLLFAANLTQ